MVGGYSFAPVMVGVTFVSFVFVALALIVGEYRLIKIYEEYTDNLVW